MPQDSSEYMYPVVELFGKTIGLYPILSLLGMFASGLFCCFMAKKRGLDSNDMIVLLLIAGIGVFLGGSLLYACVSLNDSLKVIPSGFQVDSPQKLFALVRLIFGGSVFYGGLLGGMAAGVIYLRKKRLPIRQFTDIAAPAIPLFHAFGRIGCFLGGCCYGTECNIGFIYTNSLVESANGVRRFPVQLLEAAFNLLLFLLLWRLLRRRKSGLLRWYLLFYSFGRFFLEFFRGDAYRGQMLGLSTSQIIGLLILTGLGLSLVFRRIFVKNSSAQT